MVELEISVIAQKVFELEMIMSPTERGLAKSLRENPNDEATRNAYIDFLIDQGREDSAQLIKSKELVPGANIVIKYNKGRVSGYFPGVVVSGSIGGFMLASGMAYTPSPLRS